MASRGSPPLLCAIVRGKSSAPAVVLAFFVSFSLLPLHAFASFDSLSGGDAFYDDERDTVDRAIQNGPDSLSGVATYSIPLRVPPGRAQMTPQLSLSYSTQSDEDISPFGYGWSLNIPYIERIPRNGVDKLYSTTTTSYYFSSIDGEIVATTTSTTTAFAPKFDNGSLNRYGYNGTHWTLTDKSGTQYTFGLATSTRLDDPASTTTPKTYRWMLEKTQDQNGNYVTYQYSKDSGQIYPWKINYTGNGADTGIFEVEFLKELRPDIATSSRTQFNVVAKYRVYEIQAKINGSWVTKYSLGYGTGDNMRRSLLKTVTESGMDETGATVSLPSTTLNYQVSTSTKNWTLDGGQTAPALFISYDVDNGTRLVDVNGDGLLDAMNWRHVEGGGSATTTYMNTSSGWTASTTWQAPDSLYFTSSLYGDFGVRLADVNGDALVDILRSSDATTTNSAWINNGSGWVASSTWNSPLWFTTTGKDNGVRIADVNGDSLPDLVQAIYASGVWTRNSYINTGSGWSLDSNWIAPAAFVGDANSDNGLRMADVNNDGLPDLIWSITYSSGSSNNGVYLNQGKGWATATSTGWSVPLSFMHYGSDPGTRVEDVNADGLPDLIRALDVGGQSVSDTYLNTGSGWIRDSGWYPPEYIGSDTTDYGVRFADINGDGIPEVLRSSVDVGGSNNRVYVSNNANNRPDLLSRVDTAKGASVLFSYRGSPQYFSGSTLLNPRLPITLTTLYKSERFDGFGATTTSTYSYLEGFFYYNNPFDKRLGGFGTTTETDAVGNVKKSFYHQGNNSQTTLGEISDSIAKAGKVFRTETYDPSGNLFDKVITQWTSTALPNGRTFVKPLQKVSYTYDGDSTHRDIAESYIYEDTYGNLTQKIEWGEVTGSNDGTFSDTGSDKRTTAITYAVNAPPYVVGFPSQETVTDQSAAKVKEVRHYYDGLSLNSISKGNETKTERWKTGSTYVNDQKVYTSLGLVSSSTDPRGKITTYTYDSKNLYVATSTNPLSQQTQFYYDYSLGKPKQTIDPNTRVFKTIYDGLDRPLTEQQPDIASPGTLVDKKAYSYTDTLGSRKVIETNYLDGSTNFTVHTYLDGLDRPIQVRKEAENGGNFSTRDLVYNNLGLLLKESLPYFSNGSSRTSATGNSSLYATYSYDASKRITNIANAVGSTVIAYSDWKETTTDPLGKYVDRYKDAYGNLNKVEEHNGGSTYTTTYTYDQNNNLTNVTDALGNVRNFTYDGLSRRLTAQDLHASADGTFGTWTYVYDDAGNLASTTDPKSQRIDYSYDNINRVLTENYTGLAGTEVSYAYDTCTEGKLRLCTATSTGAVTKYTYNALGLVASEQKTIATTTYTTSYSYDRQGNQTGIVYPDNSEVQYTYNTAGLLEIIAQKESGGAFSNLVNDFDYAPTEKVTFKGFGNGVESLYTYDAGELYRLRSIFTSATSTGFGNLSIGNTKLWTNLARAVEKLPFAMKLALDFTSDSISTEEATSTEMASSTSPEESLPADEEASTTVPVIETGETSSTTPSEATPTPKEPSVATTTDDTAFEVPPEETEPAVPESAKSTPSETQEDSVETEPLETPPVEEELISLMSQDIRGLIADLASALERASTKGQEIAKLGSVSRTARNGYDIEILSMEPIEGGLQVFTRAWDKNGQIGFGEDGTVDVERFRIFNPPILVPDEQGTIEINSTNEKTGETIVRKLREDPKEALLQVIEQALAVKEQKFPAEAIVPEKVGNTTSIFYPVAGANSPVDGYTGYWNGVPTSYATAHDAAAGHQGNTSGANIIPQNWFEGTPAAYSIYRGNTYFDTSPIGDGDAISTATLSLYGEAKTDADSDALSIVLATSAGTDNIVADDYDQYGTTKLASDITFASFSTTGYNNFSLNSTGTSSVSKTAITKLAQRTKNDISSTAPLGKGYVQYSAADVSGTTQDPKLTVEHTNPNDPPLPPTSLLTEGLTDPANISDPKPEFSAIYNDDPAENDIALNFQIQVGTSTSFATSTLMWDSGKTLLSSSTPQGTRSPDISYAGTALASSTTYYWRIRFWDTPDAQGAWSTATSTFSLEAGYVPPSPSSGGLQNMTFTYDAAGNITQIVDKSSVGTGKTLVFGYDDLHRLTSASTTAASSTPYRQQYSYNALGNLTGWKTGSSATSSYTYAGTSYANPHAPTTIVSTTLAYDNNGNLTAYGVYAHTWDYRNRMTKSASSTTNTFYTYDHTAQRVTKGPGSGNATTTYPNIYYNVTAGATTTKQVYMPGGGELVATIATKGATTTKQYVHTDWLGGTGVVSDNTAAVVQTLDYYPYGAERINTGSFKATRKFIGQESDAESSLSYLINRYYEAGRGQFLSQDPNFWNKINLSNPQSQNSYSYAENNPINKKDPDGLEAKDAQVQAIIQAEIKRAQQQMIDRVNAMGNEARAAYMQAIGGAWDPIKGISSVTNPSLSIPQRVGAGIGVGIGIFGGLGNVGKSVVAGEVVSGLKVTKHAAERFVERNMSREQIETAIQAGTQYIDQATGNILYVIGERGKAGYSVVSDAAQKALVTVQNFVPKLTDRFKPF